MIDILLTHQMSCAFMTGLIWLVQLIHYPSFLRIRPDEFQNFHKIHSQRITFIVGPIMVIELASATALTYLYSTSLFALNLVGVLLIWISTALLSVPLHNQLTREWNETLIQRLVITNWPRTILWTLRSVLLLTLLAK